MWEQCPRADGGRIVDIRVAWWCDPERLETLHYTLGSRAPHRPLAVAIWYPT